jgi:hypothetical protein
MELLQDQALHPRLQWSWFYLNHFQLNSLLSVMFSTIPAMNASDHPPRFA